MRPAFVFSPDLCTGCEACRVACAIENGEGRDTGWRAVYTFNEERDPALPVRHLSLACNHCDIPACAEACPAKAYRRDDATGAMLIDQSLCIGCSYCSWVCPYDAPRFDSDSGVMTKCTFCDERVKEGRAPACATGCPTSALTFGARESVVEPQLEGLGVTGLGPALIIRPPRRNTPPEILTSDSIEPMPQVALQARASRKITARSEWTLVVFTTVMPALVAWLAGGVVRPERTPGLVSFASVSLVAMLLSGAHLGKPLRAWRSILNVRSSWLSREIVFANAFFATAIASLVVDSQLLRILALLFGIAMAYSIDAVYRMIGRDTSRVRDGAEVLLSLAFLIGIATGNPIVAWSAGLIKVVLFVVSARDSSLPLRIVAAAITITSCALVSAWPFVFALAVTGELLGRIAFYSSLRPSTPASRMRTASPVAARVMPHEL